MLPSSVNKPWAGTDRYKDFGAQYHSQPDGHARSVHPRVLSVYASTVDFGGVSGDHSLCRPYTNAATLDTEPLARSYSGGILTRLSANHFQFARAPFSYFALSLFGLACSICSVPNFWKCFPKKPSPSTSAFLLRSAVARENNDFISDLSASDSPVKQCRSREFNIGEIL